MLGHKVSIHGIEIDWAKIETIEKLPLITIIKGKRSFLGCAGFDKRFIKDLSKITKPLCKLLEKDAPFMFDENYLSNFQTLKKALISTPIIAILDWSNIGPEKR